MDFFEIFKCIMYILSIFIFLNLIDSISDYFKAKVSKINNEISVSEKLLIDRRLNFELKFLELINALIVIEIQSTLKSYLTLNLKYKITHLDDDIKQISEAVYKAIKTDIFTDVNHLFTAEYLLSYITKQTTLAMLAQIEKMTNVGVIQTEE